MPIQIRYADDMREKGERVNCKTDRHYKMQMARNLHLQNIIYIFIIICKIKYYKQIFGYYVDYLFIGLHLKKGRKRCHKYMHQLKK